VFVHIILNPAVSVQLSAISRQRDTHCRKLAVPLKATAESFLIISPHHAGFKTLCYTRPVNDTPTAEDSPPPPPERDRTGTKLAWAALITGILSWPATPFLPVVFDIAAIACGILALRRLPRHQKTEKILAWIGLLCVVLKFIVGGLVLAWVIIAFIRNPVAH